MRKLRRYIAIHVLSAIAIVTLALTGLQVFILFVNQLQDIGKGGYDFYAAMKVVGFQLPYQIYSFFPIASLLGVLMGLGVMANHRELVAIRAAGVSVSQIAMVVLQVAFVLMLTVTWFGESIIPQFNQFAIDEKVRHMSGGQTVRTKYGVWMRENNDFLFIGRGESSHEMMDVLQFHFEQDHRLRFVRKIKKVIYVNDHWDATDVEETRFYTDHTAVNKIPSMRWEIMMQPTMAYFSNVTPTEMTFSQLYQYIVVHQKMHQSISNEQLVFWQRLMQPFSTMVMMMLGIPFIFGPLRSSTMGSKLLMGGSCGFIFYTFDHFLGSMSQVFQLHPVLAATLPTCLFMLIGAVLLTRVR